jgi:ABC-type multidrug transport system permease subunit
MKSPIVIVAAHHLRRLVRRPALVLFLTAVPLTLAFVESAAFGPAASANGAPPPVPVLFADEDQSGASRALEACVTDGIGKDPLAVTSVESRAAAEPVFRRGAHAALIVASAGFERGLRDGAGVAVKYFPRAADDGGANVASEVLETCVALANGTVAGAATRAEGIQRLAAIATASTKVAIDRPPIAASEVSVGDVFLASIFPGLALFAILFISQAMAALLLRDRTRAIQSRIFTLPVRPWEVFGGSLLYLVSGLTVLLIVMGLLGGALLHLQLQSIPALLLLGVGFTVCAAALQLLIGATAKTDRGAQSLGAIAVMMLSLFGGAFIPVENYPPMWRALASLLPNGAAQAGMARALSVNAPAAGVGIQVATIWIWAAALSLAAFAMRPRVPAR